MKAFILSLLVTLACTETTAASKLPIVDLGYERHQAISFDAAKDFFNFTNIRYAQPPIGDLRFRAPLPPVGDSTKIEDGSVGRICPQAIAGWNNASLETVQSYLATGKPGNASVIPGQGPNSTFNIPLDDPRSSEDCLFLDVVVPRTIFDKAEGAQLPGKGAPVLVMIHGGGYVLFEKNGFGLFDPSGLLKTGDNGFIYVTMNYRLGVFGWAAGPTLQADGIANAGLYDQRLALQWVQDNIHLFGGDKDRVTVMGESAGGGSILHQITAFGGLAGKAPFQQAILQSPGVFPVTSPLQQEQAFQTYLASLNITTIQEARQLPSEVLIEANAKQVSASPYGNYAYNPAIDSVIIPGLPGRLLSQGSYDKDVRILVDHVALEGVLFTSPNITSTAALDDLVVGLFPDIDPSIVKYISTDLYPAIFDGSQGYKSQFERGFLVNGDIVVRCNAEFIGRTFKDKAYAYEFAVAPAIHGLDLYYIFAANPPSNLTAPAVAAASAIQTYITSFVMEGEPKGKGFPDIPLYGSDANILYLNGTTIVPGKDDTANERCRWWQQGLVY